MPALYAASVNVRSPSYLRDKSASCCAPAIIFCSASNGSVTPYSSTLHGMSCITPIAPAWDTQFGLKSDSVFATALSRFTGTPVAIDARSNISSMLWLPEESVFALSMRLAKTSAKRSMLPICEIWNEDIPLIAQSVIRLFCTFKCSLLSFYFTNLMQLYFITSSMNSPV